MSKGKKIVLGIVIAVVAFVGAAAGVWFLALNPYRGTVKNPVETMALDAVLTEEQVREDMAYVMTMFRERHPAWLEGDNERAQNVEMQYMEELKLLGSMADDERTVLAEWQMISRIMHELYDGHSGVYASYNEGFYIDDFTQLNEIGLPTSIDGVSYDEAFKRFCDVYQYEMESFAEATFQGNVIINETYLRWCGFDTSDGVDMTYDTDDGELTVHYEFVPITDVKGYDGNISDEEYKWVYYDIDTENGIGIFTLTSCEYNDEYKKTVKEFFTAVNEAGIKHVIVDLRWNGGGNSMVADEFLKYVDIDGFYTWGNYVRFGNFLIKNERSFQKNHRLDPQYSGDIYVLTNTRSFSAAMDFTMDIMDNDLGTVVGEACGNLPDSYGDVLSFQTPNSGLRFSISYKRWFRTDESKSGQPLEPDYPCPSDEAMDLAYDIILQKVPIGDPEELVPAEADDEFSENIINAAGDAFIYQGKTSEEMTQYEFDFEYYWTEEDAVNFSHAILENADNIEGKAQIIVCQRVGNRSIWAFSLDNTSDEFLTVPDYDGFCRLRLDGSLFDGDPRFLLLISSMEGIRKLETTESFLKISEENGIDWYEVWPDLEEIVILPNT